MIHLLRDIYVILFVKGRIMKKILVSSMNGPIAIEVISYLKKKFYVDWM